MLALLESILGYGYCDTGDYNGSHCGKMNIPLPDNVLIIRVLCLMWSKITGINSGITDTTAMRYSTAS